MCVPLWPANAVAKIKCSKFQTLYSHRNIISYDLTFFLVPLFRGAFCIRPSLMSPTVYTIHMQPTGFCFGFCMLKVWRENAEDVDEQFFLFMNLNFVSGTQSQLVSACRRPTND